MKIDDAVKRILAIGMTLELFCEMNREGVLKDWLDTYSKKTHLLKEYDGAL